MTMSLPLAADGIVSVFLLITICYAMILNRKLSALRADKGALKALVGQLAEASASAEAGVAGLRAAAHDIGRALEKKLQDAERPRAAPAPALKAPRSEPAAAAKFVEQMAARLAPPAPSRAERELLRALGGRR
jgi:peptidoglycan hydrolase CwlO-like protein